MSRRKRHNPEKTSYKNRSYKKGGTLIKRLKEKAPDKIEALTNALVQDVAMADHHRTATSESAARKQDESGEFYRAFDHDTGLWGVFGTVSGYCYETFGSDGAAYEAAERMTEARRVQRIHNARKRQPLR
jgi:hypothetical protein